MKKVAVFGNTGGGKSTLAKELAEITSLPLITIDKIMYKSGGEQIPHAEYLDIHSNLIEKTEVFFLKFGRCSLCEGK